MANYKRVEVKQEIQACNAILCRIEETPWFDVRNEPAMSDDQKQDIQNGNTSIDIIEKKQATDDRQFMCGLCSKHFVYLC